MFADKNDYLTGRKPAPIGDSQEIVAARFALSAGTADLALNTVAPIGILPAGHVPIGLMVDADDLDTNGTPTLSVSVGILNDAGTDLLTDATVGGAVFGVSTIGRAGGQEAIYSKALARCPQDATKDRIVGIKVTAAAATAAAGEIGVTLKYRPA